MKRKITKRDVKYFFFGVLAVLLLELVLNWKDNVKAFEKGLKGEDYAEEVKEAG
jgi:hypothetical protein